MFSATVMVGKSAYDWKTMPTERRRGATSLTTRSSKRTSPASGRSKPAIRRSVVVLPQPEPPTRETSSPRLISRQSPSTAIDPPKRLVRPPRLMRTSAGELFEPALDEPVLVDRVTRLHEIGVDQVHVQNLLPTHGDVRPGDPGATPGGVRSHRRRGHGPVEEAPGVLRVLGAPHQRVALERPRHAVGRVDHVNRRPLRLGYLDLVGERDADRRLARRRHAARRAAG